MPAPAKLSHTCDECQGQCQPIPCSVRPEASEFYCTKCHKSYHMELDTAKYMIAIEAQSRRK